MKGCCTPTANKMLARFYLSFLLLCGICEALVPSQPPRTFLSTSPTRLQGSQYVSRSPTLALAAAASNNDEGGGIDQLSDERKANLFQYLLRDLQVEGVPLLAVDADQLDILQAAMWTTLAELCDQPTADKACLVLEDMDVADLQTFVRDFANIKAEERLISVLPELTRISLSLVGRGVGPAILIDVAEVKAEDMLTDETDTPEPQLIAAVKAFSDRLVQKTDTHPYKEDGTPTLFKLCRRSDVPHVLSSFWNSICEIRLTSEETLGTSILMLPGITNHERFAALSELVGRSLCLFQGDEVCHLSHYFPDYDREKVYPADEPAFGHIPPLGWLNSMIQTNEDDDSQLSDVDIALSNYQRRSPVTSIAIKRVSLMDLGSNPITDLTLETGETVPVSDRYAENAKLLAAEGEAALEEALASEKSIVG